jgi:hypothetical protein
MMDAYDRFHSLLRRGFCPILREDGFKGNGTTFRRINGDAIHMINVQGSIYGGQCCVNLAVHFSFLPTAGGRTLSDSKKLKCSECDFRDRLHEETESDHWWRYGTNDAEAESSVANLIDTYKRWGTHFFDRFEPFPEVFERITPAEIDTGDLSRMPAPMILVHAALTLARIMHHLGRKEKCHQFADIGLRHLGHAVAFQDELERLRDAP